MVTNEFAEASAELIEIFKYLPKAELEKVPLKLRNFFEKVAKQDYIAHIDPYKPLEQQYLKEKTKDLISVIYMNYWATEEERLDLNRVISENDKKYEEELREKYNPDNIFKNKTNEEYNMQEDPQEIIKYEKKNIIQKIFEKIKSIFKRKY